MRSDRRARRSGLTLLEVMAAVALMGLVYTALASKATQGVMSEGDSLRRFQASLLADELLAEIETAAALQQSPEPGSSEEESEDGIFTVTLDVTPWNVPLPEDDEDPRLQAANAENVLGGSSQDPGVVLEVRVRIAWQDGIGERAIERVTFLLDLDRLRAAAPGTPLDAGT
jgi:prepilin-type N-terminal cleavage/methylation domain-containing protein